MNIFLLLIVPICIALAAFLFGKGKIDPRELAVQLGVTLLIVCVPYAIALHNKTADKEIWNGVVASKDFVHASCCHPYCCQTCETCDSKGNCSSYCCQTCYEHSYDDEVKLR